MKRKHDEMEKELPAIHDIPFKPVQYVTETKGTSVVNILTLLLYSWQGDTLHYVLYVILWLGYKKQSPTLNRYTGSHIRASARTLYDAANQLHSEDRLLHTNQDIRALLICILGVDELTQQLFYRFHDYHKLLFHSKPPAAENLLEFKNSIHMSSLSYLRGELDSASFIREAKEVYVLYSNRIVEVRQDMNASTPNRYL